jgi:parallel beta-helix repeat protein
MVKVAPGTYREQVIINKSITLLGQRRNRTIIDATGLSNGIYVDGLDNGNLSQVTLTGFTVENANFEGILVTNASDVTIWGNTVTGNDRSLQPSGPTCAGQPSFETAENSDCGEGIHLIGTVHSMIADNVVERNAGGILISDETTTSNDNIIARNLVRDNLYASGITLASHLAANPSDQHGGFNNDILAGFTLTSIGNGQYQFSFSGADTGSGVFTTTATGTAGRFLVTGVTGTTDGSTITGVLPVGTFPSIYPSDNMLFAPAVASPPNQSPSELDLTGVSFATANGQNYNLYYGQFRTGDPFDVYALLSPQQASQAPAKTITYGVYNNTVADNDSAHNGFGGGSGGGGVSLLAPGFGNSTSANTVIGNRLVDNSMPGILLHDTSYSMQPGGAPNPDLSNNTIVDNFISGNGPDPSSPTAGPTGISASGPAPIVNLSIARNWIGDEQTDVTLNTASTVDVHLNDLLGRHAGIVNLNPGGVTEANENWWGCIKGPGAAQCTTVSGGPVVTPWLTRPRDLADDHDDRGWGDYDRDDHRWDRYFDCDRFDNF